MDAESKPSYQEKSTPPVGELVALYFTGATKLVSINIM